MSEWKVEIVQIGDVEKHQNADLLSITQVKGGYPCIFKTGDFQKGDKAVYIPVDSIVPETPEFSFVSNRRIKAKKLRGIFSMGLLVPVPVGLKESVSLGDLVHEQMNIKKWLPEEETRANLNTSNEKAPDGWDFHKYTDIEGLRAHKNVLEMCEEVVISEKYHGSNGRFSHDGDRLWVGSHNCIKKYDERNMWWQVADKLNLSEKLAAYPKKIFFGEVYGANTQKGFGYNLSERDLIIFDIFDLTLGRYMDWDDVVRISNELGLKTVFEIYRGPWQGYDFHEYLAEGQSFIADHIREGFVVKPTKERWDHRCGRVILKLVGQAYLLKDK